MAPDMDRAADAIKQQAESGAFTIKQRCKTRSGVDFVQCPSDAVSNSLCAIHARTTIKNGDFILKDSGERQQFATGAVRDKQVGKGRFDLIPPIPLKRLAMIFEAGSLKYESRNWERGMPLSRFLDSAKRHLSQFEEGLRDEDHLGQTIWNLWCLMHTQEMIKRGNLPATLADLPDYRSAEEKTDAKR